jgi:DNA polymerase-1
MNFQNLPRKADASPEAIEVRNCIRAREGYTLVFCDFDQIEVRLLGHLTNRLGYPEIVNAFLSPEDFFVVVARDVYQEPDFQKSDLRRTTVKNFVYGGNYGAGVDKLSQTAGITYEQAMVVDEGLKRAYPGIKALHREVEQQALRRLTEEGVAYVKSPFTGRRHPLGRGEATYVLVNYLIQGTAAELFKLKLLELDNAGLGPYMILPIHDEVILEVPTEDVPDVVSTLKSVMNDDQLLAVPITAGVSVGERWGQKRDYDPEEWKHAKARPQLHP